MIHKWVTLTGDYWITAFFDIKEIDLYQFPKRRPCPDSLAIRCNFVLLSVSGKIAQTVIMSGLIAIMHAPDVSAQAQPRLGVAGENPDAEIIATD